MFTAGSVLLAAVGSLTASRNRVNGLPFWTALGCGMLYGAATSLVFALLQGHSLAPPIAVSWWLALLVSIAFEGLHPELLTLAGAGLAVTGNVLMLRRG